MTSGGFPIGRLFNVPIYVHWTWLLLLFVFTMGLSDSAVAMGVAPPLAYPVGLVTALLAFACLLAHEYGHVLAARHFGIPTHRITLFALGGAAALDDEPKTPWGEFLIAIAGPAVNVVLLLPLAAMALLGPSLGLPAPLLFVAQTLAVINFVFAAFNMLPGFPMDGGRVLRAIVWGATGSYLQATRVAVLFGRTVGIGMIVLGTFLLFGGSFNGIILIALGIFLQFLAGQALRVAQFKSAFASTRVGDLMRPVQAVVPGAMPVRRVVEDYIGRIHQDRFPVVRESELLGFISADDIYRLEPARWDWITAEQMARPYPSRELLRADQDAMSAFRMVMTLGRNFLPVFRDRTLIGFLFAHDVAEHLKRSSGRPAR